jgi:hypothetical protein
MTKKETADIVEQLRKSANTIYSQDGYTFRLGLHNEAADEIERLREHCDRMASLAIDNAKDTGRAIRYREALKEILAHETDYEPYDCIEIARAALKEGE